MDLTVLVVSGIALGSVMAAPSISTFMHDNCGVLLAIAFGITVIFLLAPIFPEAALMRDAILSAPQQISSWLSGSHTDFMKMFTNFRTVLS